jgi:hypothetical protein
MSLGEIKKNFAKVKKRWNYTTTLGKNTNPVCTYIRCLQGYFYFFYFRKKDK